MRFEFFTNFTDHFVQLGDTEYKLSALVADGIVTEHEFAVDGIKGLVKVKVGGKWYDKNTEFESDPIAELKRQTPQNTWAIVISPDREPHRAEIEFLKRKDMLTGISSVRNVQLASGGWAEIERQSINIANTSMLCKVAVREFAAVGIRKSETETSLQKTITPDGVLLILAR